MDCSEKTTMDKHRVCFSCAFWINRTKDKNPIVIDGVRYALGSGSAGGMGGRKFTIKMNNGKIIETHDLWCRGDVPEHFKDRIKDNAEFCGGACAAKDKEGKSYAFNPSK